MMGPGCSTEQESQAKANLLISIAGKRKDCMATISPHRANVVNVTNARTQTNNILKFFSPLSSSSYCVFDTGYKYMFDRFNNEFRFVPCNGGVAGLMVRTGILHSLGSHLLDNREESSIMLLNLAYNPSKEQRDLTVFF